MSARRKFSIEANYVQRILQAQQEHVLKTGTSIVVRVVLSVKNGKLETSSWWTDREDE